MRTGRVCPPCWTVYRARYERKARVRWHAAGKKGMTVANDDGCVVDAHMRVHDPKI